jgi:hypothetical protein
MLNRNEKLIQLALKIMLLVIALNAFGGGYYGMAGAKDVPPEWLEGSPFVNYFIPSLILFVCIGGLSLYAFITLVWIKRFSRTISFSAGLVLILWILVQVSIIGFVSWLQPAMMIAGTIIILLARNISPSVK